MDYQLAGSFGAPHPPVSPTELAAGKAALVIAPVALISGAFTFKQKHGKILTAVGVLAAGYLAYRLYKMPSGGHWGLT